MIVVTLCNAVSMSLHMMFMVFTVEGLMVGVPIIGAQMVMFHQMGKPIPNIIKINPGETGKQASVKALAGKMIQFEPKKRISMSEAVKTLKSLGGTGTLM